MYSLLPKLALQKPIAIFVNMTLLYAAVSMYIASRTVTTLVVRKFLAVFHLVKVFSYDANLVIYL